MRLPYSLHILQEGTLYLRVLHLGSEVWMLDSSTGLWVSLLGIVLGVLGFFYAPLWLGAGAVLLGIIALGYSQKLGWVSLILGVIILILTLY